MEKQICLSLVHQHLLRVSPGLAVEFDDEHKPEKVPVKAEDILARWREEQLARGLVHKHLKAVAPALAKEFRDLYAAFAEEVPGNLLSLLEKIVTSQRRTGIVQHQQIFKGRHVNVRNEQAKENKTRRSPCMRKASGKRLKFSAGEDHRLRQAVANGEDYKKVAKELGRFGSTVQNRMIRLSINPESHLKKRRFTLQQDLEILDRVMPQLASKRLSQTGLLFKSDLLELGTELHRSPIALVNRWERTLQPWLLQHFTGSTGFRVETVLASTMADKYQDCKEIDWRWITHQHKEFAGHTHTSLRHIYSNLSVCARKKFKLDVVTPQQVAAFVAETYKPMERKGSNSMEVQRDYFVSAFKAKIGEFGINIEIYMLCIFCLNINLFSFPSNYQSGCE